MAIRFHRKLRLLILEDVIRALKIMNICPCSPDVGDCSKCRNPDGTMKNNAVKTRRRAQFKKSRRKTSRRK